MAEIDRKYTTWRRPATAGLICIGLTFGVGGVWSATAPLKSAISASGTIAAEMGLQTVQHLEGGIVGEILVKDGDKVEAGQLLFRLDGSQTQADLATIKAQMAMIRLTESRLLAEMAWKPDFEPPADINPTEDPAIANALADERGKLRSRASALASQAKVLNDRIDQVKESNRSAKEQVESAKRQLGIIDRELPGLRSLLARKLTPLSRVTAMESERENFGASRDRAAAELARGLKSVNELNNEIETLRQTLQSDIATELLTTRRLLSEGQEKLRVAADRSKRLEVRAPKSGIVQGSRFTTIGAVIRPGDPICEIAPLDVPLVIKVKFSPSDVEQMTVGLLAEVRFPSFKQKEMPYMTGKLTKLSNDSVYDEIQRVNYFAGDVTLDMGTIPPLVLEKLRAGMPADTIVVTGERTVLSYLTEPLFYRVHSSMLEE
jgi:HlyD family secretion protein